MKIFSSDSRAIKVWGPTASVKVVAPALGDVVDDTWILVNFSVGAREITDIRQCFNDVSYIYALGNNQGQCAMSLTFAIFIGKKECNGSNSTSAIDSGLSAIDSGLSAIDSGLSAIDSGLSAYVESRISKKTSPSPVTIGNFSRMGWLTGIDIGNLDASKGICYSTAHFIMELEKKKL